MKINVKATNVTLTEQVSAYINDKVEAISHFLGQETEHTSAQIEVGKETKHKQGEVMRAEINLHLPGKTLRAVGNGETLFAALDEMRDEVIREVTSYRRKQQTLFRRGGRAIKNLLRRWRG